MTPHRVPPKPIHYETAPEGTCRWCNLAVGLTRTGRLSKSRWHSNCFREYELLFFPSVTRKAVWSRDKGLCNSCNHQCDKKGVNGWCMDHITPLIEASRDLKYWRLENLQTLCKICHTLKTSSEATERARIRKLNKNSESLVLE